MGAPTFALHVEYRDAHAYENPEEQVSEANISELAMMEAHSKKTLQ